MLYIVETNQGGKFATSDEKPSYDSNYTLYLKLGFGEILIPKINFIHI